MSRFKEAGGFFEDAASSASHNAPQIEKRSFYAGLQCLAKGFKNIEELLTEIRDILNQSGARG